MQYDFLSWGQNCWQWVFSITLNSWWGLCLWSECNQCNSCQTIKHSKSTKSLKFTWSWIHGRSCAETSDSDRPITRRKFWEAVISRMSDGKQGYSFEVFWDNRELLGLFDQLHGFSTCWRCTLLLMQGSWINHSLAQTDHNNFPFLNKAVYLCLGYKKIEPKICGWQEFGTI